MFKLIRVRTNPAAANSPEQRGLFLAGLPSVTGDVSREGGAV